jgi:hypothetical protein
VIELERTSDLAVVGIVEYAHSVTPEVRARPDRWSFRYLVELAHLRMRARAPEFETELALEAREYQDRLYRAGVRAYALGAFGWARLGEPTVDSIAKGAMAVVDRFIEQFIDLFRRNLAVQPCTDAGIPTTPATLLIKPLISAACAPPAETRFQLSGGPVAA